MSGFEQLFPGQLPRLVMFDLDGTLIDSVPDLAAAVDNISKEKPVFFERAAFSDGLSEQQLAALQEFIATEGMAFLRRVNEENIRYSLDPQVGVGYRVNTGVYFYAEPQD